MGRGANETRNTAAAGRPRVSARLPRDPDRDRLYANLTRIGLGSAFDVGGGPRDDEIGRRPKDRDIAVPGMSLDDLHAKLKPEGTVVPLEIVTDRGRSRVGWMLRAPWTPKEGIEIMLARQEVSTGPRHQDFEITPIDPAVVDELVASGMSHDDALREVMRRDAVRRDWTVNAVMRNVSTGETLDFVGGLYDIRDRVLRPISADTCRDDPMRTLRGISRMSQDNLVPTRDAAQQIRENAPRLEHLTQDKIFKELSKTLKGAYVGRALRFARDTGALQHALPEFAPTVGYNQHSPFHALFCDEHIILAVQRAAELDAPMSVRWAMLLHDLGKPTMGWSKPGETRLRFHANEDAGRFDPSRFSHEDWSDALAEQALDRSQMSNEFRTKVRLLVREHMFIDDAVFEKARSAYKQKLVTRQFTARVGRDNVEELMLVRRCDRGAKGNNARADYPETAFERVVRAEMGCPMTVKELAVSGGEMIEAGLNRGPHVGAIQRSLLKQIQVQDDAQSANARSGRPLTDVIAVMDDKMAFRAFPLIERWAANAIADHADLTA